MPRPSDRSQRIAEALSILCAAVWLAACSGGGGGGGGGGAPAGSSVSTGATSGVTLGWSAASGPVAGYSVYVKRGSADYKHEADVPSTHATVYGVPGSTARVIVVPFDAANADGPMSPSSVPFTFPSPNATNQGAAVANGGVQTTAAALATAANPPPAQAASAASSLSAEPLAEPVAPALPGGALVWQSGNAFRLTNAAIETTRLFARPEPGAQLAGAADFDADGQDDLLWVSATSDLGYTPGSVLRGSGEVSLVDLGSLSGGEQVVGTGDFDGDGYGDVLVATGSAVHARLTAPGAAPAIADLGSSAQAMLVGIADFDANGSDDVAWRVSTGEVVVWLIDGGSASGSAAVALTADTGVIGVGDFDGDGAAEIATRGPDGVVSVLYAHTAPPELEPTDLADTQAWTGMGAVDLEGDGTDELLLAAPGQIRFGGLPGDQVVALDPASPWQLVAVLP
jgi:hypothetical protein